MVTAEAATAEAAAAEVEPAEAPAEAPAKAPIEALHGRGSLRMGSTPARSSKSSRTRCPPTSC